MSPFVPFVFQLVGVVETGEAVKLSDVAGAAAPDAAEAMSGVLASMALRGGGIAPAGSTGNNTQGVEYGSISNARTFGIGLRVAP